MARMIPAFTDEATPPGECDAYTMFAAGPDDWLVIHSLDLAPVNRYRRTEIDFVVVVPDTGILCAEVKSQEHISFENGQWYPSSIKRSPFKQAIDGRFALYRRIFDAAPALRRIPVVHICIFPRSAFQISKNFSVASWELMDERAFRRFRGGAEFCADVRIRMRQAIQSDPDLTPLNGDITVELKELLASLCVPMLRHNPDRREEIQRREQSLEKLLREQQKPVLQLVALNQQVLVTGPAGTGKTLIALEVARRKSARGMRTGLLCFNSLVGRWIHDQVESTQPLPNLVAGSALKVMAEIAQVQVPHDADQKFWEDELPSLLMEKMTDPDFLDMATFDYLVLDEAQDLLGRQNIWDCLGLFLHGGFENGNFVIFGDLENQVLQDLPQTLSTFSQLEKSPRLAKWRLTENCRNYQIVGETAATLAGFTSEIYSGYLRVGGSHINYDMQFYDTAYDQQDQLRSLLKHFIDLGYRANEIVVLSFRHPSETMVNDMARHGHQLRPVWRPGPGIGYESIHAFKGMESKVVILVDVQLSDTERDRSVLYVGMTRAIEFVRILCDSKSRRTLVRWLTERAHHA
jgi:hypothetical protein